MKFWGFRRIIVMAMVVVAMSSCASSVEKLQQGSTALINNVSYKDSNFNNSNASNGFLVQFENKTYGITAKHVLMIAKTDKMKFVDFEGALEQWKMHPKDDTTKYVILDQLLSTNRKDLLTWEYMGDNWETYNDWLVFSIKENDTNHKQLKFRGSPLNKGENLYAIGWTYKDTIGAQRTYEYKFDKTEGNYHNLIQIKGPKNLGGLSGAPIVDEKGKLVGLVSSGWEDEKTKETILQATSVDNIIKFLEELN